MKATYPENWGEIAQRLKERHNWRCERCGHPHEVETGHVLTVHHLDGNPANCEEWNLAVLCQRCHLHMQHINIFQGWLFEKLHSDWFKPHLKGFKEYLRNNEEVRA